MAEILNQTDNEFVDPVSNEDLAAATNQSDASSTNDAQGSGNEQVDNIVAFVTKNWPDVAAGFTTEQILSWATSLDEGADYSDLRKAILTKYVGEDRISEWVRNAFTSRSLEVAAGGETEEARLARITAELISGEKTFYGLGQTLDEYAPGGSKSTLPTPKDGTEIRGGQRIPEGMRLVKVGNLFYGVGMANGVEFGYLIGDEEELEDTFTGGVKAFDDVTSMSETQFQNSDILPVGSIDEVLGAGESIQAVFDRDMAEFGLESPPQWLKDDIEAMTIFVAGTNEGWSTERIWSEVSRTDGFKTRFSGLETIQTQLGASDYSTAITEYLARESEIRAGLLRYRGPDTNVSIEYVQDLIAAGWQAADVVEMVELEAEVKTNQAALDNINDILAYNGLPQLTADDFVDFLKESKGAGSPDFEATELFESINDALRQTALINAGIDVSDELAVELGIEPSYSIASPNAFNDQAQYVAGVLSANRRAIEGDLYGLEQDDILKYFLGEADDPEIGRKLERVGRERGIAAGGYSGVSAYIDGSGRLRAQGLADAQ